jgi:hypothetical protein
MKSKYMIFAITLTLAILNLWLVTQSTIVSSQDHTNNLRNLLMEYQTGIRSFDTTEPLIIRLAKPLVPEEDPSIFLPSRTDIPDSPVYTMVSVGHDHVCLERSQARNITTLCIPFTNIAVIREVKLQ